MKKRCLSLFVMAAAVLFSVAASANTLQVGPGKPFAAPCAAITAAQAGDTIQIDSSVTYTGDVCAWSTDNLTIVGVGGGRAHIDAGGLNSQGKATWVISGKNTTIENIELSGATVPDQNGAGIRQQADNLTLRNCFFHDNQDGILTDDSPTSTILIEFSEFANNGFGDGQTHNVYITHIGTLIFRYNYSHNANVGHLLKSRAANNFITYNRLSDEATGTSSYQIDLPNGGKSYVIGNVIEQGPKNNNDTFISYMEEGANPANPDTHLFVINNSFANDFSNGTFVFLASGSSPAVIKNNIFFGPGSVTNQGSAIQANNFTGDPKYVNEAGFDYHLQAGSPAIDAGADPGSDGSISLTPVFQYVHPSCAEGRATTGAAIDIGAYEAGGGNGMAPPLVPNGSCGAAVAPPAPSQDFSLSLAPGAATINAGQTATFNMNVSAIGGFSQTVAFTCAGAPAGAACSVTPNSVNPSGSSTTVKVSVTSTARGSAIVTPHGLPRPPDAWLASILIVLILIAGALAWICKGRPVLSLGVPALALLLLGIGCGGGSGNGPTGGTQNGTPAGTSSVTITGTAGSQSHTATVTLVVN